MRESQNALTTEIPSNPLLRRADLRRLRKLVEQYVFLLMFDETIGNLAQFEVPPYADVNSLSKIFSGDASVMGSRCAYFLPCTE